MTARRQPARHRPGAPKPGPQGWQRDLFQRTEHHRDTVKTPHTQNRHLISDSLVPYRRLQMWAWWAVWLEVAAVASVVAWAEPAVGLWYGAVAVMMGVAQLVTLSSFRRVS